MRIIAEKNGGFRWFAWWADEPEYRTHCSTRFGAVDKLLKRSNIHTTAVENLTSDLKASRRLRVEMIVKVNGWAE
jgi:hypothetical protein